MGTAFLRSDFHAERTPTFEPPTQRFEDMVKGLLYYAYPKGAITTVEFDIVLGWMHAIFGPYFASAVRLSKAEAIWRLDKNKSPGWYWRTRHGSRKGDVLRFISRELGIVEPEAISPEEPAYQEWANQVFDYLHRFHETNAPIFSATLKDELRATGKAPRLFVAGPIENATVGNWLFGGQNDSLMQHVLMHPVAMGIEMPGWQLCTLLHRLAEFGDVVAFDAAKWDASLPLWLPLLCAALRKRYLPTDLHADVDLYYSGVYQGWVEVHGEFLRVLGQKSGQTLTASDNSLCGAALLCLHAVRSGMGFAQFRRDVLPFVMGDDLIYSTRSALFDVAGVARTYATQRIVLENDQPSVGPRDITTASFLGCQPVYRMYRGRSYLLPLFRVEKLANSALWRKRKTTVFDMWSKLVSITVLLFADQQVFERQRDEILAWFSEHFEELQRSGQMKAVEALFGLLNSDAAIFRLFTGLEASRARDWLSSQPLSF